jgi:hypothetical protein
MPDAEKRMEKADTVLRKVRDVLWPKNNADHEWTDDDIDTIIGVLKDGGWGPDAPLSGGPFVRGSSS